MDPQAIAAIIAALGVREVVPIIVKGATGRRQSVTAERDYWRQKWERSFRMRLGWEEWGSRVIRTMHRHGIPDEEIPPKPPELPDIPRPNNKT